MKYCKFKVLLSVVLASIFMNGYSQNDRLEELSLHKWIKGERNYEVSIDFKYAKGSENLEKFCSKFFFKDTISSTLAEATDNYLSLLGKEKKSLEADYRQNLKMVCPHCESGPSALA